MIAHEPIGKQPLRRVCDCVCTPTSSHQDKVDVKNLRKITKYSNGYHKTVPRHFFVLNTCVDILCKAIECHLTNIVELYLHRISKNSFNEKR